tara:strand:- start:2 stop:1360 length:1359 start_codon:yes stop_codon:yes gene_type:complete
MIKEKNKLLNEFSKEFAISCYDEEIISYDSNLLSINTEDWVSIAYDKLYNNKRVQYNYCNIVEEVSNMFFIDIICSFSDVLSLNYNSVLSFTKNREIFILDKKIASKKNIYNINTLLDNKKPVNILFPIFFSPSPEKVEYITKWINILSKLICIKRVIILSIFETNITNEYNEQVTKIFENFNCNDIILSYTTLINKSDFFNNLYSSKKISEDLFKRVNMFIDDEIPHNNFGKKMIQNKLFLKLNNTIEEKKSKMCLSIEHLDNPEEIIKYTNLLGSYIVALKINTNFIFNESLLNGLKKLANHHKFIIIDDKKLKLKSMNDLKKINVFKYVDAVSINFEFIDENIDSWINNQRSNINPNASFILNNLNSTNHDLELIEKQYLYFNQYLLGIIDLKSTSSNMFSILNYSDINRLNDDFKTLKNADMVNLGEELYTSKNPIDVVTKINKIIFS